MKALMESSVIVLLFLDLGTRRGWGVSVTPRPLSTPGKDPGPIVQEAGWAPGPVWTDAKNLAPTGTRSPDRSARSQSLYRLSYPAHSIMEYPGRNSVRLSSGSPGNCCDSAFIYARNLSCQILSSSIFFTRRALDVKQSVILTIPLQ
jgi:hypothetical protein